MPWNQTTFDDRLRPAVVGMIANTRPKDTVSKIVADAAGIAFGLAVFQGTAANQITATFSATLKNFVGVTIRDMTLARTQADIASVDKYKQYESAGILREGTIWVTASLAVAVGDLAYVTPAGAFTNTANAGANAGPIGRWDSATAGAAIARLELMKKSQ